MPQQETGYSFQNEKCGLWAGVLPFPQAAKLSLTRTAIPLAIDQIIDIQFSANM